MKVSFISTNAISQTLRYQMMRMQAQLVQHQKELATGRLADPGVSLGARAGTGFSMAREIDRLTVQIDANSVAQNRLAATQNSLTQLGDVSQELLSTLTAALSGVNDTSIVRSAANRALESMTSVLNSNLNGEYLFAGINTDVRPLNSYTDAGSPAKDHFDTLFEGYFHFDQDDPAASAITNTQVEEFLDAVIAPSFMGADWYVTWSNASDQKISSRISANEVAETSITANGPGIRKFAMAATVLTEFLDLPLNEEARKALYQRTVGLAGEAVSAIASMQAEVGLVETRVKDASDRISSQIDLFQTFIYDLEGVDPYEASTRVNELLTQIETSYALTARIQQLSLLRYLP
ncbi:flagellar hook-associated family protein [Chelativorans sp. Marseille-P2723]|uniref:flagellar hook-associated family protein n=1 Tax=Chelativorans sp. Marseille-P2723 TaxID=2709133 RepID=UPI0015703F33|nr:flagellar hook-associated family protein [Chelativorans sp. Marseille-P2723]